MSALLADVGGTKTFVGIATDDQQLVHTAALNNDDFPDLLSLLRAHLSACAPSSAEYPRAAALAVAAPVTPGMPCQMTNRAWVIDADEIGAGLQLERVEMMNDIAAIAWAVDALGSCAQAPTWLNGDAFGQQSSVAILSVGTGLGEAALLRSQPPSRTAPVVLSSEGGHKLMMPFDTESARLLYNHWQDQQTPLSRENWLSGTGLPRLHHARWPQAEWLSCPQLVANALADEPQALATIELFFKALFAEAGDVVLQYTAWDGVLLCGGLLERLRPLLARFPQAVTLMVNKSNYQQRLAQVPVAICTDPTLPLRGLARALA